MGTVWGVLRDQGEGCGCLLKAKSVLVRLDALFVLSYSSAL